MKPAGTRIDVLLSTFNGSAYVREQIASILGQEGVEACILARDDGSTDSTQGILEEYANSLPGRFILIREPQGNLGIIRSYEVLLAASGGRYIAFADQDDVWDRLKLAKSFELLLTLEGDGRVPALVYTDLRIVSESLALKDESFFSYMGIDPLRALSMKSLSVQNSVVGCTTLFNRALADVAQPFPAACLMHDWWLALCAAQFGRTAYLPEATISYRQHGANAVGARTVVSRLRSIWRRKNSTFKSIDQALALLDRHSPVPAGTTDAGFLTGLKSHTSTIGKKMFLLENGALKNGLLRNLYFFLLARSN